VGFGKFWQRLRGDAVAKKRLNEVAKNYFEEHDKCRNPTTHSEIQRFLTPGGAPGPYLTQEEIYIQLSRLYDAEKSVEEMFSKRKTLSLFDGAVSEMEQEQERALVRMQKCERASVALDALYAASKQYDIYTRSNGYKAYYLGAKGVAIIAAARAEQEKKMEAALAKQSIALVEAADSSSGQ